jgi:tRNA(His) 5'-end guanylyltransferase
MSDKSSLGDRMKGYEAVTRAVLPRRTYTIIRVDGRSFHSYLRGSEKPYDYTFMSHMDAVAGVLCKEISGAQFAYVQSDEISVLVTDFASHGTQPWFGGIVSKMVSVSAALAAATLSRLRPEQEIATFDSRVFTVPDPTEVAAYFIWRQRDCVKNSIAMAAQAQFSHKELHGVNTDQMQEKLWTQRGINWSNYPDRAKRGRVIVKTGGDMPVAYTDGRTQQEVVTTAYRTWWEAQPAPHFSFDLSSPLRDMIPEYPTPSAEGSDR